MNSATPQLEKEVLVRALCGQEDKQIACETFRAYSTIAAAWARIYSKVGVSSRRQILARITKTVILRAKGQNL